jgi:hypothetical protein
MNGQVNSCYTGGSGEITSQGVSATGTTLVEVRMPGGIHQRREEVLPGGIGRGFTYTCSGDTFTYNTGRGVGPDGSDVRWDIVFHRIR